MKDDRGRLFEKAPQDEARLHDSPAPELEHWEQGESMPVKSVLDDLDWPKPRSKSEELRQDFVKKIIELMEHGESPWQRPWKLPPSCMPVNAVSDKPYNGSNIMYLMITGMNEGYSDPRWATYKQAQEKGWQVKKGERGTKIEYYSKYDPTKTKKGEEQLNERIRDLETSGVSPEEIQDALENYDGYKKGFIKHYTVFNAEQIEGIPPREIEPVIKDFKPHERAENIMDNCGVSIVYGGIGAAYSPSKDRIRMPNREWFNDESQFYATVLHEIAHSTMHPSRLNREEAIKSHFGAQEYAKEELRAEMSSLFINANIGLAVTEEGMENHMEQHAAYVQHWLKNLKDDYKEFFRATRDANKIADYVLAYEKERSLQMKQGEPINMTEVQAAEMKASVIQGLDKSADGNTQIEGQDIGYVEESYVVATNEVKYEAQRARTEDGEQRAQEAEKREESISPRVGQRVTFHPHNAKVKLTGKVVDVDDETVTLQSGRAIIPALRNGGVFTEAREPEHSHTREYAKEQAQKHVGEQGKVFLAKGSGETYKGVIVEKTPTFAIQKVNAETAILHRLKDLETKEKDGHGVPLRENEDFHLIEEGKEVSITRESLEKGGTRIQPWDREREEKQKVRELERSRGSQAR